MGPRLHRRARGALRQLKTVCRVGIGYGTTPVNPEMLDSRTMPRKLLVMGVSGCGKSSTAAALARALGALMIEGDDHHLPQSQEKMRRGIALDDEDRGPWLDRLGALAAASTGHVVVSCSALKRRYRERLRAAAPALVIVYRDITPEQARARVAARTAHWFPASLVDSQFATLEPPVEEPATLWIDASWTIEMQCEAVLRWLGHLPADGQAQACERG